jgi:pimeloyl-ACP methyl ester carboxylesterase
VTTLDAFRQSLEIPAGSVVLDADIVIPKGPQGVVLFVHGSGSSRHSPRNRYVAGELQTIGLATVLADLLNAEEERLDARTAKLRFDIGLLAARVIALTDWLAEDEHTAGLSVGYFGASTGAAAALIGGAARPGQVKAIVSRGGRPDLAGEDLHLVRQPTLLIAGGSDEVVIDLNRRALQQLTGEARLEIIPGAGHLFEEPGALEQVAGLARDWFGSHLKGDLS